MCIVLIINQLFENKISEYSGGKGWFLSHGTVGLDNRYN